ncbi:MAG TPA: TetR/AcrR family transcriptional regulator [Novosphingobium sp.]|nr:TetR/AcrR family transcriptional regulator [Novosphingobium sp.]
MATSSISFIRREAPNDARQVRSRNALMRALLTLLALKPFDQLTIREITAEAGTGYATFFRHYATKEALLGDVAAEQVAELNAMTVPVLTDGNRREPIVEMCRYVWHNRQIWRPLLTGGAAGMVRDEFIRSASRIDALLSPNLRWLPGDLGMVFGAGCTFDLLAWWLAQEQPQSPEEIGEIMHLIIIAPLLRESGSD